MQTNPMSRAEALANALILGFMAACVALVLLISNVAHAATLADAAASPSFLSTIGSLILAHLTLATVLPLVLAALGYLGNRYLSAQRKSQIAEATDVAFHGLDGIHHLLPAGKVTDVIGRIDDVLKAADDYMDAKGWRTLSPNEMKVVSAQVKAAVNKSAIAVATGSALTSLVPPSAPPAA